MDEGKSQARKVSCSFILPLVSVELVTFPDFT